MALINCPECNKQISDKCAACPNCGYPVNTLADVQQTVIDAPATENKSAIDGVRESAAKFVGQLKSSRKTQIITACVAAGLVLAIVLPIALTANSRQYKKAEEYYSAGKYAEAAAAYEGIIEYRDAEEKYSSSVFNQAKTLYDEEKFADAKELFTLIGDYNGASVLAEKCDYFQSTDGKFLLDFSRGLNARWKAADKESYTTDAEYIDWTKRLIGLERDAIEKYKGVDFADTRLKEIFDEYMAALDDSENALGYFVTDYSEYDSRWSNAYEKRTMLITELLADYDIKVDKENELTRDEFLSNANAYTEQNNLKDQLRNCLNNIHFEQIEDDYGWRTYEGYFVNETEYVLDYICIEALLTSKDGVVIESAYCTGTDRLEPGQKARYEFTTDKKFDYIDTQMSYDASKE